MNEDQMLEDLLTDGEPQNDKLGRLSAMLFQRDTLLIAIGELESKLKVQINNLKDLEESKIPDLFDELGLKEITTEDGKKVKVDTVTHISITRENQREAYAWMRENGFGDMIKEEAKIHLIHGAESEKTDLCDWLQERGFTFGVDQTIHPSTLKAWGRRQVAEGKELPELFSQFTQRITRVK